MKKSVYALLLLTSLILSCENEEITKPAGTKLDYYIESFDFEDLWFAVGQKVVYDYDEAGALTKYTVHEYNVNTKLYDPKNHFVFSYVNGQVSTIKGYHIGSQIPFVEYFYQYSSDSRVLKIIVDTSSWGAGKNSEASFTYNDIENTVTVSYTYSTGGSSESVLYFGNENILSDKNTQNSQPCSNGLYTYDTNKNPFKDLGYVDFLLTNLSANNKLTENVNYDPCSPPAPAPKYYTYKYNENGYPTVAITFYEADSKATSERRFFYK